MRDSQACVKRSLKGLTNCGLLTQVVLTTGSTVSGKSFNFIHFTNFYMLSYRLHDPMGGRPGLFGIAVESRAAATVAVNGGLST